MSVWIQTILGNFAPMLVWIRTILVIPLNSAAYRVGPEGPEDFWKIAHPSVQIWPFQERSVLNQPCRTLSWICIRTFFPIARTNLPTIFGVLGRCWNRGASLTSRVVVSPRLSNATGNDRNRLCPFFPAQTSSRRIHNNKLCVLDIIYIACRIYVSAVMVTGTWLADLIR